MRHDELPKAEFAFPGPLRDQLVAAILSGHKTSTTGLLLDYEMAGDPLPKPGERAMVIDSGGNPVAVIETTAARACRVGDIDLPHAIDEGEGYESVAQWRAGHEKFWHSKEMRDYLGDPGFTVGDDTVAVTERFRVVERIWRPEQVNNAFGAEATALAAALRQVDEKELAKPTCCPPWTVKEEFAHTAVAVSRTPKMLDGIEPDGPLISAAQYFQARNANRVADAISFAARHSKPELIDWFETQVRQTLRAAEAQSPVRKVTTRWGDPMLLTDFQVTRVVELAVHGLDLADALGVQPWLTDAAAEVVEGLFVPSGATALRRATGWSHAELLRKATGRTPLTDAEQSEVDGRGIAWLSFG